MRAVMHGRDGLHRDLLLDAVERAGGADPVTFLTTGNLAFTCDPAALGEVVDDLEGRLEALVERPTPVFVRTIDELATLLDTDPFADQPYGAEMVGGEIAFAKQRFRRLPAGGLRSRRDDVVVFAVRDREAFSVQRLVGGRTGGAGGLLERHHGHPITSRAPGTIERILAREA